MGSHVLGRKEAEREAEYYLYKMRIMEDNINFKS